MRTRRGFLVPVIIVLATAALAAGGVAVALPAAAAITGAGFPGIPPYGGYLGNYIAPDGTRVYCIDAGRDWPSGSTGSGFVTGAVNTEWGAPLDAATIQRFNFVLTAYGQTTEPETAAAVNAYLYAFTSGWARTHGSGYAAGLHYINGNPGVGAAYAKVWATAEASAGSALVPAAALVIEMTSPRDGTVRVTATPSTSVGTLTLIGAVAADTGETSVVVRDGAEIVIRGVPDPGVSSYSISAAAQFRAIAPPGPAVTVYVTGNQQRTIRHSAPAQLAFEATTTVGPITIPFAPVLASEVEHSTVGFGERLIDSLTVTLADPEQVWPLADGVPLPIVAVGTLYGPFPAPPTNAEHPPADAPVHGTARIALTGTPRAASIARTA